MLDGGVMTAVNHPAGSATVTVSHVFSPRSSVCFLKIFFAQLVCNRISRREIIDNVLVFRSFPTRTNVFETGVSRTFSNLTVS